MNKFEIMPMNNRPIHGYKTRENLWVEARSETHYTLPQIARKYDISKDKLLLLLPRPDIRSPYGNRTRMWEKSSVIALLEPEKISIPKNITELIAKHAGAV